MQRLMMEQATQKQSDSEESDQEDDVVTQSDLKEYSKKLQVSIFRTQILIQVSKLCSMCCNLGWLAQQ